MNDFFGLTETWLHQDDHVCLCEASPPSHVSSHIAVAIVIVVNEVAWQLFTIPIFFHTEPESNYSLFESLSMSIVLSSNTFFFFFFLHLLEIVPLGYFLLF